MKKKRLPAVIDTNVLVVANQKQGEQMEHVAACARTLLELKQGGRLVLDGADLIFTEYRRHSSFSGSPGAGDSFFKWLVDNRYKQDLVSLVEIGPEDEISPRCPAFRDDELNSFDYSDRKFVAAALAHPGSALKVGLDSDYWMHRNALRRNGVTLVFVCGESHFEQSERGSS
jgi:hypothetical protein